MGYLGNAPALAYTSFAKQDFTVTATTSYSLDHPVANANELALFINFVRQEPTTSYSASGTTLTLTEATSSSDDMYCVYLGKAVQTVNPPNNSVTNAMLGETITVANGGTGVTTASALANTGNLVLLNSQTVTTSVSTVAFDNTYFTDDYEYYKLMFYRVMPSTGSSHFQLEYSTDNGSSFISGAIYTHRRYMSLESTTNGSEGGFGTGDTRFASNITSTASRGINGEINFFNFRQTWNKYVNAHTIGQENSSAYQWRVGSWIINTSKINYMRFFWGGGSGRTFTDGRFDLYGVKS